MSRSNPLRGDPRVHGELMKLGISISQAAVSKYMVRHRKPPSQTWRSFLDNHVKDLVSVDFFTLPTATFRVLFVVIVLRHDRRRIVHFNVTEHPSAEWTAQQIVDAFPWDTAPRYMLRARDGVYGRYFKRRVTGLRIQQVPSVPRSPWQSPYVDRVIGSIRRECLEHVIVLNERHLRRILREYVDYYHSCRTHWMCPEVRGKRTAPSTPSSEYQIRRQPPRVREPRSDVGSRRCVVVESGQRR